MGIQSSNFDRYIDITYMRMCKIDVWPSGYLYLIGEAIEESPENEISKTESFQ